MKFFCVGERLRVLKVAKDFKLSIPEKTAPVEYKKFKKKKLSSLFHYKKNGALTKEKMVDENLFLVIKEF